MTHDLEHLVPFLMYRVMARGSKRAAVAYAKLALSIQEARVMIALQHHSPVAAGRLGEITCLEPSALSHILRRLSRRGLVRRRHLQHDARSVEVSLTAAGRRSALQCVTKSKAHEEELLHGIGAEARQRLRETLTKMFRNTEGWDLDSDIGLVATRIARSHRSE